MSGLIRFLIDLGVPPRNLRAKETHSGERDPQCSSILDYPNSLIYRLQQGNSAILPVKPHPRLRVQLSSELIFALHQCSPLI